MAKLPRIVLLCGAPLLLGSLGCQPKPAPPKLPPREVPQLQVYETNAGQRSSVVQDAVQVGSNLARFAYQCAPAAGKGKAAGDREARSAAVIEGKGVLSAPLGRCELDLTTHTVTLASAGDEDECPRFQIVLTDYHGPDTYNTAALRTLSFGLAKVQQPACKWDANLCLNWSAASSVHPEASCTVVINSDGGLQYVTGGATISGTFGCSSFISSFKGCSDGERATVDCAIPSGSFSLAGCSAVNPPQKVVEPRRKR